ncbi:MAG: efflux transporter outer membrane subunit [Telmatospirillum sp.]|nr:efflux transporter outer membrane subunit [Telmatospirillum sp.]
MTKFMPTRRDRNRPRAPLLAAPLLAAVLLSGCVLAPDHQRPDLPVPDAWQAPAGAAAPAAGGGASPQLADQGWTEFFSDPALQGLIRDALSGNRDLKATILSVEAARAAYGIAGADLWPTVSAGGGGTVTRTPRSASTQVPPSASVARSFSANLAVTSYEIDLFGRVRSLSDRALEHYLASADAAEAARISLIAEVANAYLSLLGDRKLLALATETLASRQASLSLIDRSFQRGSSSGLDVAQARSAVEAARAAVSRYQRQVSQDRTALDLLVGAPVAPDRLEGDLDRVRLVTDLPVGVPSEVLLHRPDISQAEHALKAAEANIGAARAAFFPTITLTGSGGFASRELGTLFQAGSGAWSFGPAGSVPIFAAGRKLAGLESAKVGREIAGAQYEKAVQGAFREVSDALSSRETLAGQAKALTDLVEAGQTARRLSQARYDRGVDSYLAVLDAERSLFAARQDLVSIEVARLSNLVTLYKVLGGGRG